MKKIILTNHARERFSQRGITVSDIEFALDNPNIGLPAKKKNIKKILNSIPNKGLLKVVYKETRNKRIIITACWEEK